MQPDDGATITLEPVIVPDVGTEATFVIMEISYIEMVNPTGLFALVPADEVNEFSHLAVRVRYTVLEPDPLTNHPRLLVEAQPVDPETAAALDDRLWEGIYLLTPDGVEQESGSHIPPEYADLVRPYWLVDWTMALAEDVPTEPIQPGTEWSSNRVMDIEGLPLSSMPLSIVGEFNDWVELPTGELAALVTESLFDEGTVEGHEFAPGVFATVAYSLMGGNDYWLIPGAFPHQADSYLIGEMTFTIDPALTGTGGLSGSFELQFYYETMAVPDTLGFDWTDAGTGVEFAALEIELGQVITGTLRPESLRLGDDTAAELYAFWGQEGDEIRIRLESSDFDAYLFLLDDNESVIVSDDDSAGGTNAEIIHVLPYTGEYFIIVNSYYVDEYGDYTLGVLSMDAPTTDPVLIPGLPHRGRLDRSTSFQFEDGTFADFYTFYGVAGQEVTVHLESNDFDAYLILFDDTDTVIEDDNSGGGTNAFIRYTLPYTGNYYVVANTYQAGELGEYTLTLRVVGGAAADLAEVIALLEHWYGGTGSTEELIRLDEVLTELLGEVQQRLPLQIANAQFVSEEPLAYGMYAKHEDHRFRTGETIWVYVEPKNYGAQWDGELYRIHVAADVYLLDADGNIVVEQMDILQGIFDSVHYNKEIYLNFHFALQDDFPSGDYVWLIVVRDVITGESASVEMPFELYN